MSEADTLLVIGNSTLVCHNIHNTASKGIWHQSNPLNFATPLLLLQLSIISVVSRLIDFGLKPLGQSSIVSQILGGIVFGPSLLGHGKIITSKLFPLRGTMMLEMIATFGIMFFFFAIGVKMDPFMMLRPKKRALTIGFSVFFFTLALPTTIAFIFKKYLPMTESLANSLPYIALSQSITAFPVIACLLTELKILNTDLGRLALSSSMFCDVLGISMTAVIFSFSEGKGGGIMTSVYGILSTVALIIGIALLIRPAILWIVNHTPEGKPVNETYILAIFVLVPVSAFVSEIIGQHFILGPLILGLAVPDGPPLGSALVAKMDTLVTGLLYPTFLAVSGLKTNVFEIHFQAVWVVGIIVVFACLVKVCAVVLPAIYNEIPVREAFALGLALNAKGINELIMYNLWLETKILANQEFALVVISVVSVTAIVTPLVKFLYDPTKQYVALRRNSIQHVKRDSELRILVCIHKQESVPTIINLLEVSHATEESPVAVIAILLVELIGRTTPMLLAHQPERTLDTTASRSGHAIAALRHYELHNQGRATVQSFTAVSHFETVHDDICQVAVDKRATMVIVPFHKHWAIDGSVGSVTRAIQNMNLHVLEMAPCSVGILVDRGVLNGSVSLVTTRSAYHVGVLFIGGADDAESLAYGARMAQHENVRLTVIRFLLFGNEKAIDRKRESDFIDKIRHENARNQRFEYLEEVVRDGVGLAALIRGMDEDSFDLMIVGRHHQDSPLLSGLDEWSECPELGVIGDMLASPDFGSTASVLVVQQQRVGGNLIGRPVQPVVSERDQVVHDEGRPSSVKHNHSATWAISMDRRD